MLDLKIVEISKNPGHNNRQISNKTETVQKIDI